VNKYIKSIAFKGLSIFSDLRNTYRTKKEIFEEMYNKRGWGNDETVSGTGSTVKNTKKIVQFLPAIFNEYKIESILDIPCGDFNWMKEVNMDGRQYYGADIVDGLIERNRKLYAKSSYVFFVADLTTSVLPKVDFILCRDCLVHLSYKDIFSALENIRNSSIKYLLTTTFPNHNNVNIVTGNWRPINLEALPFDFPKPIALYYEDYNELNENGDKALALWNVEDIPGSF
jgi:hypothetical protein